MTTMATHISAVRRRLPTALQSTVHPVLLRNSPPFSYLSRQTSPTMNIMFMSSTAPQETSEDDVDPPAPQAELDPRHLANIYNQNRALYKKSVSSLRKRYAAEIATQRKKEEAAAAKAAARHKRQVLERRRLKALRSVENALRQKEKLEKRREEWHAELEMTQRLRDRKKELYRRARQRVVDRLEEESHLWLTNVEEVDEALGSVWASQGLWVRDGGIIGAPSGESTGFADETFWRYECHTWDARPTYKTPAEIMLEELEEMSFAQANINSEFWNDERVRAHQKREERARLRAIVREEGRRALLERQREMMRDVYGKAGEMTGIKGGVKLPPSSMPAPKLDYLADYEAQEKEGVKLLRKDARKFFVFESDLPGLGTVGGGQQNVESSDLDENTDDETLTPTNDLSTTTSMGRPITLRNPFFTDRPTAFPIRAGRDLPADSRTEKEKKRDERQERMRAAAEEAALAAKTGTAYEIAMAASEDLDDGSDPVDYDEAEQDAEKDLWAGQQDEWNAMDRKVFGMTPPFRRLTNDEIDWLLNQLKAKAAKLQDRVDSDARLRRNELAQATGEVRKTIESVDEIDDYVIEGLGYDVDMLLAMTKDLTPEQSMALEKIDFTGRKDITLEEVEEEVRKVEGLTQSQVKMLAEMEMSLLKNEAFHKITKMG